MPSLVTIAQVVLALGLINVWVLRFGKATAYRGGSATNMREEFAAYGLPPWFMMLIGAAKLTVAGLLLAGLFMPGLARPAAYVLVGLMVGALAMHLKVKDPPARSLPAALMLSMSLLVALG